MMKRIALIFSCMLILVFCGCVQTVSDGQDASQNPVKTSSQNDKEYEVVLADDYAIVNTLEKTYAAGEEVIIKLETLTEHYYVLLVNGVEQEMDIAASDMEFTYFTFMMPNENVVIEIEDCWVDVPD